MNNICKSVIIYCAFTFQGLAQQNLVPNPSFEDTIECDGSTTFACAEWYPLYGSPDYYKSPTDCWSTAPIPSNFWGYQLPRTGQAYLGADMYCDPSFCSMSYREAFQTKLIDTLIQIKKYCVSLYVSLAENCQFATDDIGVLLTPVNNIPFPNFSQINNAEENYIVDTSNWTLIRGIYFSNGDETFLSIGNFKTDANTSIINNDPSAFDASTYYYFDDVSVIQLPDIDAGENKTIQPYTSTELSASCDGCWEGLQYAWYPSEGLNDSTLLNPTASPDITTTYYLSLIDTSGTVVCMSDVKDSMTVFIEPGPDLLIFPNPVNHGEQFQFYVGDTGMDHQSAFIYDAAGRLVWQQNNILSNTSYLFTIELATGSYSLVLRNGKKKIVQERFVVVK